MSKAKQPTLLEELNKRYIQETLQTEWQRPRVITQNEDNTMKYRVTTDKFEGIERGTVVESSIEIQGIAYFPGGNKWFANEHYINAHKQYFEPVEEVQEGQYWEWEHTGRIIRIDKVSNGASKQTYIDGGSGTDTVSYILKKARKLSTDEIEQALVKEAKRRGFEGKGKFHSLKGRVIQLDYGCGWEYRNDIDQLKLNTGVVYENGEWAEPIEQTPHIEINGYEAEFCDGHVKFGCATINMGLIKDLYRTISSHHKNNDTLGNDHRKVQQVKIGNGTFTVEDLKKIAEHYE